MPGIFESQVFALELGRNVSFKQKTAMKSSIVKNGGKQAYVINKKTTYLLASPEVTSWAYSSKVSAAFKFEIPIVNFSFIQECVEAGAALPIEKFLIDYPTARQRGGSYARIEDLDMSISTVRLRRKLKATRGRAPPFVAVYPVDSPEGPNWPKSYDLAQNDVLQKGDMFFDIELHVCEPPRKDEVEQKEGRLFSGGGASFIASPPLTPGLKNAPSINRRFRVFTHHGHVAELEEQMGGEELEEGRGRKECRYLSDVNEARALYVSLFDARIRSGYRRVALLASSMIGSRVARQEGNRISRGESSLSPEVQL